MAFPPAFLDELVTRNPIEDVVGQYVNLTKKGNNLFGLCPFHGEKTASFSVAVDKQIYYCFGCHKGGGVVNFIMEIENLSYPDSVRYLAKRAGLEVPEDEKYQSRYRQNERLWALCKDAARFFHEQLMSDIGKPCREYIVKRGYNKQTVTKFGFGYAPNDWSKMTDALHEKGYRWEEMLDAGLVVKSEKNGKFYDRFRNRLMVPIIDLRGNIIGFGGRVLDDSKPKYLNSPETAIFNKRKNLFGLNVAKKTKYDMLILCEGYMDAIALHQYGFDCAVASLGTSLTEEQATLMSKYTSKVVLTYDGDEAGQNATKRAIPILEKTGLQVKVLRMQGAKDPDEFLKKFGADRFRLLLEQCENQAEYRLESLKRKFDLNSDEQRIEFLKQAAALVSSFSSAVEREIYGHRAAEAAGVTPEAMKLEIGKAYKKRKAIERKAQEKQDLSPATQQQPKIRSIRYDNIRSAMAEEGILQILLKEPELFEKLKVLNENTFSSPVLGKAFRILKENYFTSGTVSASCLGAELSADEMSHISAILQKNDLTISEKAFADYQRIILEEAEKRSGGADLLAMRDRMKDKKSYGG